ncbi:helix-turn-helix domain-containing protein [Endozoicomonas ascidiicola]|uniref:helix-turn-helix domain-containing protein n=1 Tax=Endozoicomonas ascidiicola TaxID=1698521 RepID=UPI00082F66E5|nr:helix-turn-helix domain-containing protein [Endozoicomonas ascidiicola]
MQSSNIESVRLAPSSEGNVLYLSSMDKFYQQRLSQAIKPHRIYFNAIIYISAGSGEHYIDYKKYKLKPGTVFFLSRYQVHQFCYNPSITGFVLSFDDDSLFLSNDDSLKELVIGSLSAINALQDEDLSLLGLFQVIQSEFVNIGRLFSHEIVRTLLRAIILKTVVRQHYSLQESITEQVLENDYYRLKILIESNYNISRNVNEYASSLGKSVKHLNTIAKENTGHTVKELLDNRLLVELKRQLAFSHDSIADISQKSGFDEATNMAKFFRRHTQLTPRQFRMVCRMSEVKI